MLTCTNSLHSLVAFTRVLEMEFGPSPYECPQAQLFKLTQATIRHDYYVQFRTLLGLMNHYKSSVVLL